MYKLVAKDAILLMKVMKLSEQLANVSPELTAACEVLKAIKFGFKSVDNNR